MNGLESILERERPWLALQPEFRASWDKGRIWLGEVIERRLENYLGHYVTGSACGELADACRGVFEEAVIYHWRSAWEFSRNREPPVSGAWVIKVLQSGMRPTTPNEVEHSPRFMGGDPLRDLVLAVSAISRADQAIELLYREYRPIFDTEAQRLLGRGTPVADWEELVSRLLLSKDDRRPAEHGDEKPVEAPLLSRYRGYTSLRNWLRPVIRNFLTDAWRRLSARRNAERHFAEQHATWAQPASAGEHDREHPLELFRVSLRRAAAQLPSNERQLLNWVYQEELPNVEIAQRLRVAPGHASRLKHTALLNLKRALENTLSGPLTAELHEETSWDWRQIAPDLSPHVLGELVRVLGDVLEPEGAPRPSPIMPRNHASPSATRQPGTPSEPRDKSPSEERALGSKKGDAGPFQVHWALLHHEAFFAVLLDDDPNHSPEAVAELLRTTDSSERPAVVCLDARRVARAERVIDWLERFGARISDEDVACEPERYTPVPETASEYKFGDFYEPRRVVIASQYLIGDLATAENELLCAEVTCLPSESNQGDPFAMYTQFLRQTFQTAFTPPQSQGPPPTTGLRSVAEALPEAQKDEWEAKMKQLTSGSGGDTTDFVS